MRMVDNTWVIERVFPRGVGPRGGCADRRFFGEIEVAEREARAAYERALALAHAEPERRLLARRLAELGSRG